MRKTLRIDEFTIWCTPEQTRKALELGASLRYASITDIGLNRYINTSEEYYALPTAEQIIGWIESFDRISEIDIAKWDDTMWAYTVQLNGVPALVGKKTFLSRPEATLAAINAALEYLITKR